MKKIFRKIKAFFILRRADKELRTIIKKADQLHKNHNKRFYVIQNSKHELIVLSWSQIKQMRKQKIFSTHADEKAFISESFYYTPNRFGDRLSAKKINAKRKAWLNYVAQVKGLL